jgi:putative SOS response-associated peptidase YedK
MCFFYSMSQVARNLENRFNAPVSKGKGIDPAHFVNGFSFPEMPVVVADPAPVIHLFRWGLVPGWIRDATQADQIRSSTLNARSETVFEKPSFRKSILSGRCLVPADGFFEWQHVGNRKIPWFIRVRECEIFSFGGIWDRWTGPDGTIRHTFSILTTEANQMMAGIHNSKKRMPLIFSPESEKEWLDMSISPEKIRTLMMPFPEKNMEAWTISNLVSDKNSDRNREEIKKPFNWFLGNPYDQLFHSSPS